MYHLAVSAFEDAVVIPSYNIMQTPFGYRGSGEKLAWAKNQLYNLTFSGEGDFLKFNLMLPKCPSIATYMNWLHKALRESGESDKYYLQTKRADGFLWVRKVERKVARKGKVQHVIS